MVVWTLLKELLLVAAAITGGIVAVSGLRTWKRQLKGQSEYELARRLLLAIYRLRDAFRAARSPLMFVPPDEGGSDAGEGTFPQKRHIRGLRRGFEERLRALDNTWSDVQLAALEAEVIWGRAVRELVAPLNECRAKFVTTVHEYFWLNDPPPYATVDRNAERVTRVESTLYSVSNNPQEDQFLKELLDAIDKAEAFIRPHLKL